MYNVGEGVQGTRDKDSKKVLCKYVLSSQMKRNHEANMVEESVETEIS